jgi:SAM-dependent methyltransferase
VFGWLKREAQAPATSLAMVGPRAADSVLFLGAGRPQFAAEVGAVTRLNGRTVVVGDKSDEPAVDRAAGEAGALLEFATAPRDATLPFDNDTFHLVVTTELADWPAETRGPRLAEGVRTLQPGGRVILIVGGPGDGLMGRLTARPTLDTESVLMLLTRCGLVATRKLAEANGVVYFEGRKARE